MPKAGLSHLVHELKAPSPGRLLIIEGSQAERLHLVNAMAAQLGYRIHHVASGSHYVGETEKNRAAVIANANNAHSILFFDEADALFGKRSTIKDAHDRYANLDPSFRGLVVLGVDAKHRLHPSILERGKTVLVRDHWPPR